MNRLFLILILFAAAAWACFPSEKKGKNLFILSGQSNMVRLDHEAFFTPWVEKAFGKENVIVVKHAKGSQPIHRWDKSWEDASGEVPEGRGTLYDLLMEKVRNSIHGKEIASVTFVWMQGERDANQQWGDLYAQSLRSLYQQLSTDLGRTDVNYVIGRLNDFDMKNEKWPHWIRVREAQVRVGESNPRFAWVDTDDLNDGLNAQGEEVSNDLHMSVEGYAELGKRFAEKATQLIREHE